MVRSGFARRLIVAALVAAQTAGLSLAVASKAYAELCPVHAALASRAEPQAPAHAAHTEHSGHGAHAGHHAGDVPVSPEEERDPASPMHGFGCCMSHIVGLAVLTEPGFASLRVSTPALMRASALTPGELAATDPPPRILL